MKICSSTQWLAALIAVTGLMLLIWVSTLSVSAATLSVNPPTGVYTVGAPFTVSIRVNTAGASVNAADATLSFNPREVQVVSVSRASSVFNLWTEEPTFSNTAGTISFGGGSPTGYKGSSGVVMTATLRAVGAGSPKLQFRSGSVLAADGLGTNVLTAMNGGTFTIAAAADAPAPEYIPPANTPQAPVVQSTTHPNQSAWYRDTTARLSWNIPGGVTAVRTLLDRSPGTVPTVVYEDTITEKVLEDLPQGVSYFHIQFKNADGWGRIAHYKLAIDSEAPENFTISSQGIDGVEGSTQSLVFTVTDTSPIALFKIQIDGGEPIEFPGSGNATTVYPLPPLTPGYHTLTAEAIDSAGNTRIASYSFTIEAFEAPLFTEYPSRISTDVIPALRGTTKPNAAVFFEIIRTDTGATVVAYPESIHSSESTAVANADGVFTYIPDSSFEAGVYEIRAVARDEQGRLSEPSNPVRLIVEVPGYIAFGTALIAVLSVIVPLVALLLLLGFGSWFLWHRLSVWKRTVGKETREAEEQLSVEFRALLTTLHERVAELKASRKNKLTQAESELINAMEQDLRGAQTRIAKEITDIEKTLK